MASTADFRNGMTLKLDNDLYAITYFQHVKPGKGGAFVRTKLKNVLSGRVIERTFRAGESVEEVRLERRPVQYSYSDGELYYFMDTETFDMIPLTAGVIGEDQLSYLQENIQAQGLVYKDTTIAVELPFFIEAKIAETDPGVRGDTAQGGTKPAKLETGAVIQVPLFLNEGDVVRVDRREDKYLERVGRA